MEKLLNWSDPERLRPRAAPTPSGSDPSGSDPDPERLDPDPERLRPRAAPALVEDGEVLDQIREHGLLAGSEYQGLKGYDARLPLAVDPLPLREVFPARRHAAEPEGSGQAGRGRLPYTVPVNWTTIRLLKEKTEMNGNYRRYMHLINAAATGLLQQIPVVGPMLQAVLAQMDKEHLAAELQRLSRLLETGANLTTARITAEQLEHDLSVIVKDEQNPRLGSTVLMAEAEAGNRLAGQDAPPGRGEVRRFLYLAANNYATAARTAQVVADLGFLWRSYHKNVGAQIPHVGEIRVGDLIALAYRSHRQFWLLLPLIVIASGEHRGHRQGASGGIGVRPI